MPVTWITLPPRDSPSVSVNPLDLLPGLIALLGHLLQLSEERLVDGLEAEAGFALHVLLQCRGHSTNHFRVYRHEVVAHVILRDPDPAEEDRPLVRPNRMRVEGVVLGLVVDHLQLWRVLGQDV